MTTILYFFWDGFSDVAQVATVDSPPMFVAGQVYIPGLQQGQVYIPGVQQGMAVKSE